MKKLTLIVALMVMACGNPTEPPIYEPNLQVTQIVVIGGPDSLYITWNPIPYVTSDFEGYRIREWDSDWDITIMNPDSCNVIGMVTTMGGSWSILFDTNWNGDWYHQSVHSSD